MNEAMPKNPTLALSVKPSTQFEMPNFFSGENSEFYQLIKNPPYLRYSGWNMLTLDYPKIFKGVGWEVNNGDRKKIRLYSDGSLVAIVDAGPDFLGWSTKDYPEINALALIEFCYEFIDFYSKLLTKVKMTKNLEFTISFLIKNAINDKGEKLLLVPALLNSMGYIVARSRNNDNYAYAHSDSINDQLIVRTVEFNKPELVAARLLEVIFRHFGISAEDIPYLKRNNDGQLALDTETIKAIN